MRHPFRPAVLIGLLLLCLLPALAQAQATRTWVSGVGDDANPCSRTAPCRTFAGAISKTAAGGLISVLDPGAYGAVTITKAMTIESEGDIAGVLFSGTNGIVINAGANDVVSLRGLSLNGAGTGLSGVRFLAGKALIIEDLSIESMTTHGVDFQPAGPASLVMRKVQIRSVGGTAGADAAVHVKPGVAGSAAIQLERLQIAQAEVGLLLQGPVSGDVRDSTIQGATTYGVHALATPTAAVDLHIGNCSVIDSAETGVRVEGGTGVLRLSGSTVTGNALGLQAVAGGQLLSYGDNRVSGNLSNGAPTGTLGRL